MSERAHLVKFGKHEHLSSLRDEGLLYMNPLPYFWKVEDQELRGDPFDGIAKLARGLKGKVVLKNGMEVPVENWVLREHPPEAERIHIFCMYALRPTVGTFPVDERNFRFGEHALLVMDSQQFMDRTAAELERQGIPYDAGLVEYVENDYAGDIGPLRKLKRFAYQSEWRFVTYDGSASMWLLRVGSIADISVIIPSSEINQLELSADHR